MKKVCSCLFLILMAAGVYAQNVALVNNKAIPAKEFLWLYKKNHTGNAPVTYTELAAYLDLYINFKLKVLDARALKLDRDTAYLNEIKNYENIITRSNKSRMVKEELEYVLNEYRDGVLMFNVSEKKIWYPQRSAAAGAATEEEQQQLEAGWIAELKSRYPVRIFEEVLRKLAKE